MRKNNLRKLFAYGCFGGIIIGMLGSMYGCMNNRHAVIAVTGTNIGVEISQNPANQSPQAKLGYQRSEVAIVPSNRSGGIEPAGTGTVGHGASDVADVLMELKFSNIFSINTSGIYQRLAVGKTAVSQPGAAFMFARDQMGNLDSSTAGAISRALQSITETDKEVLNARSPLTEVYNKLSGTIEKKDLFDKAAQAQGYADFESFVLNKPSQPTVDQVNKVREKLEEDNEIKTELAKLKNK